MIPTNDTNTEFKNRKKFPSFFKSSLKVFSMLENNILYASILEFSTENGKIAKITHIGAK